MNNVNYVCTNGGKYCGKDDEGKFVERYIACGDKVYLEFNYCFSNMDYHNPCDIRPSCINHDVSNVEKFCRCVVDDYGTEIYLKQEKISRDFRPIVHKHLVTVAFITVEEMNKWLIDKSINLIKDIKIGHNVFLVIYIDNGDD